MYFRIVCCVFSLHFRILWSETRSPSFFRSFWEEEGKLGIFFTTSSQLTGRSAPLDFSALRDPSGRPYDTSTLEEYAG